MSKLSSLEKNLDQSCSYREWMETAPALDEFEDKDRWRMGPESGDFDHCALQDQERILSVRHKAGFSATMTKSDAVTLIQRFGAHLISTFISIFCS